MAAKACTTLVVAGLIVAGAMLAPRSARAIEVKKDLYNNSGPAGPARRVPRKKIRFPRRRRRS